MAEKEEQLDQILEEGAISSDKHKTEVIYYRPKFHRRVLANFVDILIFAFIFAGLFSLSRYIMVNSREYNANFNAFNQIRVDSGVYIKEDNGQIYDIITYLNSDSKNSTDYKMKKARQAIESFIDYAHTACIYSDYADIVKNYNEYRLKDSMVYKNTKSEYNGTPLFVQDGDQIIENPVLFAPGSYVPNIYGYFYTKAYTPYIDTNCQGFLTTKIPHYYELTRYMALMLIFAVIVPSYLVTGILVYYVPTICFRRNRYTLGKALYHIGIVDGRVLSPSFGRITARFAIFYFAELVLSVVTFGLPFLISFSIMVFSKNKQGFPDYMLGLTEIDTTRTKIYKTYDEADFDRINAHKEPVDFKVPNFD